MAMSSLSEVGSAGTQEHVPGARRQPMEVIAMDAVIITEEVVEDEFNVVICMRHY